MEPSFAERFHQMGLYCFRLKTSHPMIVSSSLAIENTSYVFSLTLSKKCIRGDLTAEGKFGRMNKERQATRQAARTDVN